METQDAERKYRVARNSIVLVYAAYTHRLRQVGACCPPEHFDHHRTIKAHPAQAPVPLSFSASAAFFSHDRGCCVSSRTGSGQYRLCEILDRLIGALPKAADRHMVTIDPCPGEASSVCHHFRETRKSASPGVTLCLAVGAGAGCEDQP
jgi:hypothetical protein